MGQEDSWHDPTTLDKEFRREATWPSFKIGFKSNALPRRGCVDVVSYVHITLALWQREQAGRRRSQPLCWKEQRAQRGSLCRYLHVLPYLEHMSQGLLPSHFVFVLLQIWHRAIRGAETSTLDMNPRTLFKNTLGIWEIWETVRIQTIPGDLRPPGPPPWSNRRAGNAHIMLSNHARRNPPNKFLSQLAS